MWAGGPQKLLLKGLSKFSPKGISKHQTFGSGIKNNKSRIYMFAYLGGRKPGTEMETLVKKIE